MRSLADPQSLPAVGRGAPRVWRMRSDAVADRRPRAQGAARRDQPCDHADRWPGWMRLAFALSSCSGFWLGVAVLLGRPWAG